MKKRHLFWIIPVSLIVLLLLSVIIGNLISPVPFKPLIIKSKNKSVLTEKELNQDLDYLEYYLTTVYAGYDDLVEKGFDIHKVLEDIRKDCDKNKRGSVYDYSFISSAIRKHVIQNFCIEDNHFAIVDSNARGQYSIYFTDIYVKPEQTAEGTRYVVVKNEREKMPEKIMKQYEKIAMADVKPGQIFNGSDNMLFEWFDGKDKIYRIGVLTKEMNLNNISLSFDGKKLAVPVLSNDRLTDAGKMQGMRETKDTLYLSFVDFVFQGNTVAGNKEFELLCKNAKEKSQQKKHVIIDLRSNGGGHTARPAMILSNILYNQKEEFSHDFLMYITQLLTDGGEKKMSPLYAQLEAYSGLKGLESKFKKHKFRKTAKKYDFEEYHEEFLKKSYNRLTPKVIKEFFYPYVKMTKIPYVKTETKELPEPDYTGDIYILTDRHSASASEYTIAMVREMTKNTGVKVHHIGENSAGAVYYVDPCSFILPNTGIWLYLPTTKNTSPAFNHPDFHGEGYGWFPEYWVTHYNLLNTLCNLIDDPELETALQGLEKWQLQ